MKICLSLHGSSAMQLLYVTGGTSNDETNQEQSEQWDIKSVLTLINLNV